MILSHRHEFIFLHSRKTAGSSMAVQMARQLGDDDIMVGCWADAIKSGVEPNKAALIASHKADSKRRLSRFRRPRQLTPGAFNKAVKDYYGERYQLDAAAHSSAGCVRAMAGDLWSPAFKFAFVRNPWDHAVSDYHWRRGPQRQVPFKEFLLRLADPSRPDPENVVPPIRSNWSVYTIDDEVAVDFVGRFENIQNDLVAISDRLGITLEIGHTRVKSGSDGKRNLRSFYDDDSVELVARIYSREIAAFGYSVPF